ncbi:MULTISPECIES: hypothetical protein [Haloferacaceae]|jgi:hypothetical protein|uniref:hypothetical protein n=1 Tax=Haloferacaceae TaxID=1644056 RepID=UPI00159EC3B1|nr:MULTISPECIES: hypothetical protein [Haloferacales]
MSLTVSLVGTVAVSFAFVAGVFVLVTAGVLLVFSSRGILSCIFVVVHRSYAL